MKHYVGVKMVQAEPAEKNGEPGYAVEYEDGYKSWSPRDVFERFYFELDGDGTTIVNSDVQRFFHGYRTMKIDEKTTLVRSTFLNGFVDYEASSCVDPMNYDHEVGTEICIGRSNNKLWGLLGFVLQWARFGLGKKDEMGEGGLNANV